jgi:hypothetical protein
MEAPRSRMALGALRPFGVDRLLPALERRFIAFPKAREKAL